MKMKYIKAAITTVLGVAALSAEASGVVSDGWCEALKPTAESATYTSQSTLSPVIGDWSGNLNLGSASLAIVFHIEQKERGGYKASMDSPDQGAKDIEAKINVIGEDSVVIKIPMIGFKYNGKVTGDLMAGNISQLGQRLRLDLKRGSLKPLSRPQTPKEITYLTEEVMFQTTSTSEAMLSGTLSYPDGYDPASRKKPVAVVMVTGSGLQDRDETVFEHRPFAVIADRLARAGVASLRYDDRGFGKSTGDASTATTQTNAEDAEGAIKYLRESGKFSKIGVLGHSEGGSIAFIEGAKGNADFIITLGAPAFKGDSIVTAQVNRALSDAGQTDRISVADYRARFSSQTSVNPWLAWFLDYDPSRDISNTKVPVMALGGALDVQVPASSNIPRIRQLLPKNKKNLVKSYPGLNHLMQPAVTGQITEYRTIETTISEEVLADIIQWITKTAK